MTKFSFILSSLACASLPFISMSVVNAAGGDAATVFKDSTSNSAVKRGDMSVTKGEIAGIENDFKESLIPVPRVPGCDLSTQQTLNLGKKNYRWYNDDVNSWFVDPSFQEHKLRYGLLCVKYRDVDFTSYGAYTPELDVVQFGKNTIGVLPGNNGQTLTKCWNVTSQLQKNTGPTIPFIINVDAAHSFPYWAVYLHEAKLSTCHFRAGIIIPPWPPISIPKYPYENQLQ
ncbi:MAG: hypothetical protein GXP08_02365 [Gammaproteobacteria bacterium]|nr:hypothetical protein [Gammaproteobacteria bacterium]